MRASRFQPEFVVAVTVDGVARDPVTVWVHQQADPYPGGHRYEVVLRDPRAREHLSGLPLSARSRLDNRTANNFLQRIYWMFPVMTDAARWEYVLNTIDTVESSGDTIRVAGECSP